ncbi:aspartyl protease family protein [Rhodanobacter sp. DHG33]|nr:aspartyl protease family protein [Rhodanobacter sp. DHG33]
MLLSGAAFAGTSCHLADYGALPVEMEGNRATTMVAINGQNTRLILDTGAMFNTMSRANATDLKLRESMLPFDLRGSGIGGSFGVELARVRDFGILGATLHNVEFLVGGSDSGMAFLGASFLDVFDLDIDLAHGKLHLMKPSDCGAQPMAYWVTDGRFETADLLSSMNAHDRRSFVEVVINGKKIRAMLDSGSEATLLTRSAAEEVGIDLSAIGAKAAGRMAGAGAKSLQTWVVPIASYSIGTETISNSKVLVMDGRIGLGEDAPDMLLGVDFFLAHRIYIANSQRKIYFTYNGGRVFSLAQAPGDSSKPDAAATGTGDALKTADDYALRGQADLSRGETTAALADLDKAIGMDAGKADWYATRARVHMRLGQPDTAMSDLDQAIKLDPSDVGNLLQRAKLKLAHKDKAGAQSDVAAARQLAQPGSQQSRVIAQFYIATGQPAEALPLLDDWINLHGNDHAMGAVLNDRCRARAFANVMADKALRDCRKAIKLDGASPAYLESEALAQLRLQDYADAITNFQQVVSQQPRWAWARYGLGLARIRSGQPDAGNADLAAAKAINPEIGAKFEQYGI